MPTQPFKLTDEVSAGVVTSRWIPSPEIASIFATLRYSPESFWSPEELEWMKEAEVRGDEINTQIRLLHQAGIR